MRKNCTSGSVPGAPGNRRPYGGGRDGGRMSKSSGRRIGVVTSFMSVIGLILGFACAAARAESLPKTQVHISTLHIEIAECLIRSLPLRVPELEALLVIDGRAAREQPYFELEIFCPFEDQHLKRADSPCSTTIYIHMGTSFWSSIARSDASIHAKVIDGQFVDPLNHLVTFGPPSRQCTEIARLSEPTLLRWLLQQKLLEQQSRGEHEP